jgi:succinyl-CoA synthetase beta subunit
MGIHEYQAKNLLAEYGVPVPKYEVVTSPDEAILAMKKLGLERCVVKAQVHAGGRGKAGGVRLLNGKDEVFEAVKALIGRRLVTYQTTAEGQPVHKVLIEAPSSIARELYLGAVVDRACQKIVVMASTEGGVDIEAVANETPEKIIKCVVDPLVGIMPYQCRQIAFAFGLSEDQVKSFTALLIAMMKLFVEKDLNMIEINPLVVTEDGQLICLDAKMNVDTNAYYRQPEIREMRDLTQEDEREVQADQWHLNYIALDGEIGCMVNGAGLAMATMDVIKLHGGSPANFLDVGGGATEERVKEAFKIILSDEKVKVVFVNIFGGIVRCDLIAQGIINAVSEVNIKIPVVVRLEGNQSEKGAELLRKSSLSILAATSFDEGARMAVEQAKGV